MALTALVVVVAALAAVQGFTHAPPPWRARLARRSIEQPQELAADPTVHLQAQQQLRRLEQISRAHLQNWAALQLQQMKPTLPPKQKPQAGADDRTDAPAVQSTTKVPTVHHGGAHNEVETDGPPSKCVWAILTCCQPQSAAVRYSCFELLSCPGAFWDGSPCEPEVTSAALRRADKFYGKP